MADSYIYVGPIYDGLTPNKTFLNGIPTAIQSKISQVPALEWLIVPMTMFSAAMRNVNTAGTPEYEAYQLLGGEIKPADPAVEPTPPVNSTGPIEVTLQSGATAPSNGTPYTPVNKPASLVFSVRGTSSSRTVMFELADPSGVFVACTAFGVADPIKMSSQTTGGSDTVPESWQVDVPVGFSFRARVSAVSGGNVIIKGKAVL